MKKIVLTGGGTAGHVTPNIALIPFLKEAGYEIHYIGSYEGIEKTLITDLGIPYYGISSGKLRRYLSLKNFTDPFRVLKGFSQAKRLMKEINPDIVFSKGGFVTVPVVKAAAKYKIPVILHESDMTPGLANKLCRKHARKICCNFPETVELFSNNIGVLTGSPIRSELVTGDRIAGLKLCGFNTEKPVLMVIGGSLGALHINEAIRNILHDLLEKYQIIHICGKGKVDESFYSTTGYYQFEYVNEELKDLFAAADIVISRAGANVICELLAMHKPALLIPLPANASRGDQILNAQSFKKQGFADVLQEENMTDHTLLTAINNLYDNKDQYIDTMCKGQLTDPITTIVSLIKEHTR